MKKVNLDEMDDDAAEKWLADRSWKSTEWSDAARSNLRGTISMGWMSALASTSWIRARGLTIIGHAGGS